MTPPFWIVVCAMTALLAGCTPPRRADVPLPPLDPSRIKHDQHAQIACVSCHRDSARPAASARPGASPRPGADDHKPCDDSGCHKKEFLGAPGKLCLVCHERVETQPLVAPLKDYPTTDAWQAMPPVFSHRRHMDADRMEGSVGFHLACADCHVSPDGVHVRPNHATCSRCHAAETGLPRVARMEDCTGCHLGGARPRTRPRLIKDDLREFSHARHKIDRKGVAIRCDQCHARSATSASYDDHAPPRIEACINCHDDTNRTPYPMRMRICETCHKTKTATLTALAPRNHLPATERPLDHTLAFRRDHAEAALASSARCAACHTQMSGNPRQACDECHQRMLPADHRITFRELDHGPEAAADRNRCATCHVVEFCTACHAQRPRSHGFAGTFFREHGRLARINVRACTTCHVESFCADCHAGASATRRSR